MKWIQIGKNHINVFHAVSVIFTPATPAPENPASPDDPNFNFAYQKQVSGTLCALAIHLANGQVLNFQGAEAESGYAALLESIK